MTLPHDLKTHREIWNRVATCGVRATEPLLHGSRKGFALVVSLVLMILLTVLAVGLLTLSSISLAGSSRDADMRAARDSARLALMMAINQLQGHAGPDQRVTATAGQIPANPADGSDAKAPAERRNWTAVYDSWPAGVKDRPSPAFRSWLVSGPQNDLARRDFATTAGTGGVVEIVGKGTVGTTRPELRVKVPLIEQPLATSGRMRMAWWVGDEGVKAFAPSEATAPVYESAVNRLAVQSAPNFGLEVMKTGDGEAASRPFGDFDHADESKRRLLSWAQTSLVTKNPSDPMPLFHDLSTHNRGLLTNVRAGGFRKDLSIVLQAAESSVPRTALYEVGGRRGINMAELWSYHNLHGQLERGGSFSYTSGGKIPSGASYLRPKTSAGAFNTDKFHLHRQPVFVRFQTVLSFASRPSVNPQTGETSYSLGVVVDPLVTLWNPLDAPLVLTGTWNSIKYWPIPYDIVVTTQNGEFRVPYHFLVANENQPQNLTMRTGTDPLVLKPGEVMIFSQGAGTPTIYSSGKLYHINGKPGWNFGGGMYYDFKSIEGAPVPASVPPLVSGSDNTSFTYRVEPNSRVGQGSQHWFLNGHGIYYKEDRNHGGVAPVPDAAPGGSNESLKLGDYSIDSLYGQPFEAGDKPADLRIRASDAQHRGFFDRIGQGGQVRLNEISTSDGNKRPFMLFTFAVKTEAECENPGRYFARYNPRATVMDFFDIQPNELRTMPFEIQVRRLTTWLDSMIDVSSDGSAYFGGGWTVGQGSKTVITHSVPRHAPYSLAAFQHAAANGFVPDASGRVDNRRMLLPQVSHAIGNSLAPSVLAPDATEGSLGGPRPLADHSYLANQALWDDWFLSGISPQSAGVFSTARNQRKVALDFLEGKEPLPVRHYKASLDGQKASTVLGQWFSGNSPRADAGSLTAAAITVEGLFNVNSTSVEAWKSLLSALRDRKLSGQSALGEASDIDTDGGTPSPALLTPVNRIADADSLGDRRADAQWAGVRVLNDAEIDALARAIVREVRKRGPFLSLADFINRRVGNDKALAVSGTIQSALDSDSVPINKKLREGDRAATGSTEGLAFPEAEQGAAAYGIPGYVKQADLLTPIAPLLSARSDTFIVRGYGEKADAGGRILARAWCEAVVTRGAAYVDPADPVTRPTSQLSAVNRTFGRRFEIISFRWLNPNEV